MLAFQRGLESKSKFTIRFEIPEEQYTAIQLWNSRKKSTSTMYVSQRCFLPLRPVTHRNTPRDLKKSLCLSLGCYSAETSKAVNSLTELSSLPSHWPQAGGLFMNALYKGQRKNFSLAPPFKV